MSKLRFDGKTGLYIGERDGEKFAHQDFRRVYLFVLGYGTDQAAELRYLLKRK